MQAAPQQTKKGPSPLKKLGDSAEEATKDAVDAHFDSIESKSTHDDAIEASADALDASNNSLTGLGDEL